MSQVNTLLIERYQLILQKDPKSKVFATLSEAYRKLGMHKEALRTAQDGLKHHPHFASGHVAIARSYLDLQEFEKALKHLTKALDLAAENILAHSLMAECYLHLKKPKQALKSFKMVLFYNPTHEKAKRAVKKLESLTADEYDDDAFSMHKLAPSLDELEVESDSGEATTASNDREKQQVLERLVSLSDAFTVRNDLDRALETLREAERQLGEMPEIAQRKLIIQSRIYDNRAEMTSNATSSATSNGTDKSDPHSQERMDSRPLNRKQLYQQEKIEYLESLLSKINDIELES